MSKEIVILIILAAAVSGIGSSLIFFDVFRVPTVRTSSALSSAVHRAKRKKAGGSSFDRLMENLAAAISRKIRMNEYRKTAMEGVLASADMKITPEMHIANCIVKTFIAAIVTLPIAFIFPLSLMLTAVTAIAVFSAEYNAPARLTEEHRAAIEYELPLLVSRIANTLESGRSRDVLAILTAYKRNAGYDLGRELAVTIADMQSGNAHAALARLESRVGSTLLSDVTRGLAAVMDGNDPVGYWASLSARLADNQRQILMRKAGKIPSKINTLSFCLLACVMLLYLVVIGTELTESLGILFG
ncbi:MAG: hypothetical protein MJ137_00640 [Clostridia bacterium]|nr:hypothetical protein [Clostridia bacterium]